MWIGRLAVRLMTVDALDAQIGISNRQRLSLEETPAHRAGMASPAAFDHVGRVQILNHARVSARSPFLERRLVRSCMTPAANLRGNLQPRPRRRIIRIGCVVSRGAMTVLALNALKLRRGRGTDESTGRAETNRMASQAARIRVLMNLLKCGKGLGVQRAHHCVVNRLMTFDARS